MMYSANYYKGKNYAVGYATAKSPLGPFVKSNDNPVLQKNVEQGGIVTGTGHNSVTWSKDGKQMYCVYHGYTQKQETSELSLSTRWESMRTASSMWTDRTRSKLKIKN